MTLRHSACFSVWRNTERPTDFFVQSEPRQSCNWVFPLLCCTRVWMVCMQCPYCGSRQKSSSENPMVKFRLCLSVSHPRITHRTHREFYVDVRHHFFPITDGRSLDDHMIKKNPNTAYFHLVKYVPETTGNDFVSFRPKSSIGDSNNWMASDRNFHMKSITIL